MSYLITVSSLRWLESILSERFGYSWQLECKEQELILKLVGEDKRIVFDALLPCFTQACSDLPLTHWRADEEGYESIVGVALPAPGLDKDTLPITEGQGGSYIIHYDILGLTYWMLTRIEEIGRTDLDNHGRFAATTSHAYKNDYLDRPIVDEWLHILGQVIKRVWPQLKLKHHQFSIKVSHDVDLPSRYGFCTRRGLLRVMGGDVIKRGDIKSAFVAPWIYLNSEKILHPKDPCNTFDWIMDVSEKNGLTSAFYFICGGEALQDADYEPEDLAIRDLMRRIHERGHEIGLHPSYNTYQNPEAIVAEAQRLKEVCAQEGISQAQWGGRMHYLRWEQPNTLYGWEQAGMSYDSSLSYADRPGFRCGTCFEYPGFDPVRQKVLHLRIRPLIAMECSIISDRYMGLGYSPQALSTFLEFKKMCKKVNGQFTLLWHNSHFTSEQDKQLYQAIIT